MATVATIIDRSLRLLGQIPSGASPTTDEYADALVALNAMVDAWRNESLLCYARRTETLTLSASDASYSIGPSGDLNTERPVAVEGAWITENGHDHPVTMIVDSQYDALPEKASEATWPTMANYRPTMDTGTLYVWPVPNGTVTMKLRTRTPLTSFVATTDTISLPPGWEEALAYNLAVDIAPEYDMEPSPTVIDRARQSKASIKIVNSQPLPARTELADMFPARHSNIISGE